MRTIKCPAEGDTKAFSPLPLPIENVKNMNQIYAIWCILGITLRERQTRVTGFIYLAEGKTSVWEVKNRLSLKTR